MLFFNLGMFGDLVLFKKGKVLGIRVKEDFFRNFIDLSLLCFFVMDFYVFDFILFLFFNIYLLKRYLGIKVGMEDFIVRIN